MSFYHAIHAARLIQMPAKKKKRSCPFSSATARPKKGKNCLALFPRRLDMELQSPFGPRFLLPWAALLMTFSSLLACR